MGPVFRAILCSAEKSSVVHVFSDVVLGGGKIICMLTRLQLKTQRVQKDGLKIGNVYQNAVKNNNTVHSADCM